MQGSRLLVLLGLVLLAAIALWLVLEDGSGPPLPTLEPTSDPDKAPTPRREAGLIGRASPSGAAAADVAGSLTGLVLADGNATAATVQLWRAASAPAYVPESLRYALGRPQRRMQPIQPEAAPLATTTAGAEGVFRLPVPQAGAYTLRARTAAGAEGTRYLTIHWPDVVTRVNVHVSGGQPSVHGTVLTKEGRPWRGTVLGMPWGAVPRGETWSAVVAETDEAGRYALHGMPPGAAFLTLSQPGALYFDTETIAVPRAEVFDIVVGSEHDVRGQVVHDDTGEPLAGVIVEALRGQHSRASAVVTGTDGTFLVPTPGLVNRVRAHKDGFATARFSSPRMPERLVLRMRPAALIRGRLIDVAGGGVPAGVPVYADMRTTDYLSGCASCLSDAKGAFELTGLHAGEARLVAWGNGWVPAEITGSDGPGRFVSCDPAQSLTMVVPVVREGRVAGRVVDAAGMPVAGAQVQVDWDTMITLHGLYVSAVTTAADGSFTLTDLPACTDLQLRVESPQHAVVRTDPYTIVSGKTTEVRIELPLAHWCDVTVREQGSGAPIRGAWVRAEVRGGPESEGYPWPWVTGADGRVRVGPLRAGILMLQAGGPEHVLHPGGRGKSAWLTVPVATDGTTSRMSIVLQRADPIRGRVTLDGRSPPTAVSLHAVALEDTSGKRWWRAFQSEADGTFQFNTPPGGEYRITANTYGSGDQYSVTKTAWAGTTDLELPLLLKGSKSGKAYVGTGEVWRLRVLGPDGKAVREAHASALQQHAAGLARQRMSANDGVFEIELRADALRLFLVVTDARTSTGEPAACAYLPPWGRAGGEDVVTLGPSRTLGGRVHAEGGEALAGVSVQVIALPPSGFAARFEGAIVGRARTDGTGAFQFAGLGEGRYRVATEAPAGYLGSDPITAEAGRSDLRFALRRGADIPVTVLGADGRPLQGASVYAEQHGSGDRVEAWTGPDGRAVLQNLDAAVVHSFGASYEREEESFYHSVEEWRPRPETVRFVRKYELKGIVLDAGGVPLPRVFVRSQDASGRVDSTTSSHLGRFTLYDLAAGPVRLWVSEHGLGNNAHADLTPTVVQAGREDVELTFDPGWYLDVRIEAKRLRAPAAIMEAGGGTRRAVRRTATLLGGRAVFLQAREGARYYVYVGPTDDGRYAFFEGVPPARGPLELTLREGGTIRGTVLGKDGKPAGGAFVHVTERGVLLKTRTQADGRYTLEGLPPGAWTVHVSLGATRESPRKSMRAEAGSTRDFDFRR